MVAPTTVAGAETAPTETPSRPQETIALVDAVLRALQNNLDITVSRQTRDIRLTDILFEQAQFDPTFNLSGRYDRFREPLNRPIFGLATLATVGEPQLLDQNQLYHGNGR